MAQPSHTVFSLTVKYSCTLFSGLKVYKPVQYSAVQCSADVQCSAVQCSTLLYSAVPVQYQCSTQGFLTLTWYTCMCLPCEVLFHKFGYSDWWVFITGEGIQITLIGCILRNYHKKRPV